MSRYIDADGLIAICNFMATQEHAELWHQFSALVMWQQTADVTEVKHGRWEYVKKRLARGGYVDASECSVCHKIIMPHLKPNYCPNCGAKIDEVEG